MTINVDVSEVQSALVEAFTREEIERMLAYRCGRQLADIVSQPRNMADLAYQVVQNATRRGWLNELVWAMKEDNPDSELVSSLEDVQIVSREIGGVSEQLNTLSRQIFELRAALFGISGIDNSGIMAELKLIHDRIDRLSIDVAHIAEMQKAMKTSQPGIPYRRMIAITAGTSAVSALVGAALAIGVF